jgi:hypothetical protein
VRDLSGAFEVPPGAVVELHSRVLPGARVLGVLVAEQGRPVADARVTLAATVRSGTRGNRSVAPEAYARSDSNGSFVFEDCAPGTKLVFAIRDDSSTGSVRLSERGHYFELAEGEEHDLGVISMAGATVRVRTRLVDQHGRPVAVEEAVAEPDPFAALLVSNAIQGEKFYATQFLVRLGDSASYEIHGLSSPARLSVGSGMAGSGLPWTLRPGFLEDVMQTSIKQLDPYQEPEVTLDYHLLRVSTCPVSFFLPAGETLRVSANLKGVAIPAGGGEKQRVHVDASGPDSFRGELTLPAGKYHYILSSPMHFSTHPGYYVRGSLDLPCSSPHEAVLARGITVRGTVTDGAGRPRTRSVVGVGFQNDPVLTGWWTSLGTDHEGRFAMGGIPPGSTLLLEGAREPLILGAVDVEDAHVVISP